MKLTGMLLVDQPTWVLLVAGLGAGLLGAVLAIFFQRVAFAVAGFFAGAYLAVMAAPPLGVAGTHMLVPIIGGVIGAVVAILLMDWAIIALSCLVGAGAIVSQLHIRHVQGVIIFVVLAVIGILIQTKLMERAGEG
jgi:hypothetical protein